MKSNKALARKILCGLLAAGVVGVSGSALAADYDNFYYGMDNDFSINGGVGNGSYGTNGYSLSAEYGKRFTKDKGIKFVKRIRTLGTTESSLAINNATFTVDQCRVCESSWVVSMNFYRSGTERTDLRGNF